MLYSTVLFVIAYKYSGVPYFSGTFVLSVFLATVIHRQVVGVMSNIRSSSARCGRLACKDRLEPFLSQTLYKMTTIWPCVTLLGLLVFIICIKKQLS